MIARALFQPTGGRMLKKGPAKKVTVYVGEDVQHHGEPLYLAVLNYLFYHGVSGATVTKGVAGFGSHHHMHTTRILEISGNLPMKVEFVEEAAKLDAILPKLVEMASPGLVDVQDTTIASHAAAPNDGRERSRLPHASLTGTAKLMRIFIGESDRWHGKLLYDALVESLRANDIAGVTVYRGISGYGAHRRFHKEKRLSLSQDLPIILSVVDEEAKIRAYLPILEQMVDEGLVVLSDVDVIKYTHRLEQRADAKETAS
jgi:PII-like signaling protein